MEITKQWFSLDISDSDFNVLKIVLKADFDELNSSYEKIDNLTNSLNYILKAESENNLLSQGLKQRIQEEEMNIKSKEQELKIKAKNLLDLIKQVLEHKNKLNSISNKINDLKNKKQELVNKKKELKQTLDSFKEQANTLSEQLKDLNKRSIILTKPGNKELFIILKQTFEKIDDQEKQEINKTWDKEIIKLNEQKQELAKRQQAYLKKLSDLKSEFILLDNETFSINQELSNLEAEKLKFESLFNSLKQNIEFFNINFSNFLQILSENGFAISEPNIEQTESQGLNSDFDQEQEIKYNYHEDEISEQESTIQDAEPEDQENETKIEEDQEELEDQEDLDPNEPMDQENETGPDEIQEDKDREDEESDEIQENEEPDEPEDREEEESDKIQEDEEPESQDEEQDQDNDSKGNRFNLRFI